MQQKVKAFLLEVTHNLCEDKITGKYSKPIRRGGKQAFAFSLVQEKQLDLETIEEKLEEDKIETYEEWYEKVLKVLEAPLPNEKKNEGAYRVAANKYVLEKYLKKGPGISVESWTNKILKLRKKLKEIEENPPSKIQDYVPSLFSKKSISNVHILTENEINAFLKAAEMCNTEEDHTNMLDIIKGEERPDPDMKATEITFDINRLKLTTIKKLRDYMESALKKEGKEYPKM